MATEKQPKKKPAQARKVCRCGHGEEFHYDSAGRCSGSSGCGCVLWQPRATGPCVACAEPLGLHTREEIHACATERS